MEKESPKDAKECFELKKLVYIILTAFVIIFVLTLGIGFWLETKGENNFEIIVLNSIITLLLSISLIYIAYGRLQDLIKQSKRSNEQQRINYLLDIDKRWSSPEIIKAREIIHLLYLEIKLNKRNSNLSNLEVVFEIGENILVLKDDPKRAEEFIYLLNFIDFLETIGYLYNKSAISLEEINELCGNSIRYFYKVFEKYIHYRKQDKDILFYDMFVNLYKAINVLK